MQHVHNMPEEAVQAVLDMDGQLLVPIHWGMFTLSMHDWFEPPVRVLPRRQKECKCADPAFGAVA